MRPICSVENVREAEAGAGVAEPVLMQRAATALSGVCRQVLVSARGRVRGAHVVALAGPGNNGGDALWALSLLRQRGVRTTVVGDPQRLHPAGSGAARAAGARVLAWTDPSVPEVLASADLALDGILGIGGRGGIREPAASIVEVLNRLPVPVVAVDVPSGVDSDTGEVTGVAVRADVTVCFGVLKMGLVAGAGIDRAGVVSVVDIGLRAADLHPAAHALSLEDLGTAPPDVLAHKYSRGVVEVVAGSSSYPGAALLAVAGARMGGAGLVGFRPAPPEGRGGAPGAGGASLRGIDPVSALVVARYPDTVLSGQRRVDARCVGPGLGPDARAADLVLSAMEDPAPVVIDASALAVLARQDGRTALARRRESGAVTVATPHDGEFARLGWGSDGGRVRSARRAAEATGAVVVLKGPGTVVASSSATYVDTLGHPALASAGTGDVLAGLMAGLLASSLRPSGGSASTDAAVIAARAVALHGLAGRLAAAGGRPVTALDVVDHLPEARRVADASAI